MNLRPRRESKEIAGLFRFKPFDNSERIADTLAQWHGVDRPKMFRENKTSKSPRVSALEERVSQQGSIMSSARSRGGGSAGSVDRGSHLVGASLQSLGRSSPF